jgi:hypothetical protein
MELAYFIAAKTKILDAQPSKYPYRIDGFDVMGHENNINIEAASALEVFLRDKRDRFFLLIDETQKHWSQQFIGANHENCITGL